MSDAEEKGGSRLDLRSGRSVWEVERAIAPSPSAPPPGNIATDVIIVGAGITGAFLAERFTREGRDVVVLDRRTPQRASTSASTALLQWEIDAPLIALEDRLGFETAAAIYRRSVLAVREIAQLAAHLPCDFGWRQSLYLAGDELDAADLAEERRLREKAGIHGEMLNAQTLAARFGIRRDAALLYGGAAEAHPVQLARGLLDAAIARGARVFSPAAVTRYDCGARGVTLGLETGEEVSGALLLLANGYEMPSIVSCTRHDIVSTYAIATAPQPALARLADTLLWEASDPYLYARGTRDGRIILGGGDEEISDAGERDGLLSDKAEMLRQKLLTLAPGAAPTLEAAWCGFFGVTDDSLPLIGPVPGQPRCYGAFGYGGNGITFSAMAADILARLVSGAADPAAGWFALDR